MTGLSGGDARQSGVLGKEWFGMLWSVADNSADDISQLARKTAEGDGWVMGFGVVQPVMTCPGCADGRGPVRERGTCRRCMGRTDAASRCTYCLHAEPPGDDG
ncbi:hypothetical protein ACH4PU_32360 [Streptomyces sp. NPDC021100]|uniref:hypothetical protein n=1 Tax=Streptomyces sp. NPDC021100 TaxID=3365114 RepID=UPI0037A68CD6